MSIQSLEYPTDPYFTIRAFPGGGTEVLPPSPVAAGTVIRLESLYQGKPFVDRDLTWVVTGPFATERRIVTARGPGWDWDTQGLRAGAYTIIAASVVDDTGPDVDGDRGPREKEAHPADPFDLPDGGSVDVVGVAASRSLPAVGIRSLAITVVLTPNIASSNADGVVPVSLQRTHVVETPQQVLWMVIRNRTNALGWRRYKEFIDGVMCADPRSKVRWATTIPFRGTEAYHVLKSATDLFLMHEAGVLESDFDLSPEFADASSGRLDPAEALAELDSLDPVERDRFLIGEERRLERRTTVERVRQLRNAYYAQLEGEAVLPYLRIIRERLAEIPLKGPDETPANCYGILNSALGGPVAMELIWSYWHEEGMLVQTLNAIVARFQNRRSVAGRGPDPLARFDLDPLRPMGNLFWGFAQDELFRLTVRRRAFEYEHEYGLRMIGRAVPNEPVVDRRSKFLEAFHNLVYLTHVFYKEDDDTTVIADAFPVLNALRETHLVLAEGAHNQFGDLPSTARSEMMIMEWLLARPEVREFLGGRIMVPYEEEWMDRVDMMKSMQGWTDSTITHFRDLGVFGEQLVLSIRYGNWSVENDPQEAANWARYWRPEIQRYAHAYRSATGVDLTERVDARTPSSLLQQRLVAQRRP